jgi:chromate transporter
VLAVTTFVFEKEIIGLILASGAVYWLYKMKPKSSTVNTIFLSPFLLQATIALGSDSILKQIGWFFFKAGAFVFGSGLAIVPFLYGGVVKEYGWLTEQQFLDAVAVAMITPGPVVITVGFIGYLVAGVPGASVAALATFLPCYLFTVLPAPYFKMGQAPFRKSSCRRYYGGSDRCYCRCRGCIGAAPAYRCRLHSDCGGNRPYFAAV